MMLQAVSCTSLWGLLLQEEVVLLLRRQSKGFVRTSTKFRGVTKDRVRYCARQSPHTPTRHHLLIDCQRNCHLALLTGSCYGIQNSQEWATEGHCTAPW